MKKIRFGFREEKTQSNGIGLQSIKNMMVKNDGKMCGYEGEEWVSDYEFCSRLQTANASNKSIKYMQKNIKRKTFLKFNGKM